MTNQQNWVPSSAILDYAVDEDELDLESLDYMLDDLRTHRRHAQVHTAD